MFSKGKTISKIIWSSAKDTMGTTKSAWCSAGAAARQRTGTLELPRLGPTGSSHDMHLKAFVSYLSLHWLK